ncbi:hypothetical protein ACFQHO_19935 [Actinomadura yumaensis]
MKITSVLAACATGAAAVTAAVAGAGPASAAGCTATEAEIYKPPPP